MTRIIFTIIQPTPVNFTATSPLKFQLTQDGIAVGPSVYDLWLANGNVGTLDDFLNSTKFTMGVGEKSSAIDDGAFGDMSLTDDYLFVCVQTGTSGNAIWKKAVLFGT